MIRDLLRHGWLRPVCPDCQRPEDLRITCRHCASEYPPQTAMEQVVQRIIRLALWIPVAVTLLMVAMLVASFLLRYMFLPVFALIFRE